MTRISLLTLCSYMFLLGGPAPGQIRFFDDFEEANARPVPWQLANVQNGTAEIVDGDFLLTPITDDCCFGPCRARGLRLPDLIGDRWSVPLAALLGEPRGDAGPASGPRSQCSRTAGRRQPQRAQPGSSRLVLRRAQLPDRAPLAAGLP